MYYRSSNAVSVCDSYPLQWTDECIDFLKDAEVFPALHMNSDYWQIEVDEFGKWKTAFTSRHGFYQFTRMPFGLKKTCATFQRVMDIVLLPVR